LAAVPASRSRSPRLPVVTAERAGAGLDLGIKIELIR
jgi:hypothetical protein